MGAAGRWAWCSPAATPPTPRCSRPRSMTSACPARHEGARARDLIGYSLTRDTHRRRTGPGYARTASRRPSRTRRSDRAPPEEAGPADRLRHRSERTLQRPQRRRTMLQPPQAVARHRNAIRQTRPKLPRCHLPLLDPHLDQDRLNQHALGACYACWTRILERQRLPAPGFGRDCCTDR